MSAFFPEISMGCSPITHDNAFYGKCMIGGILSCGITHTAISPLDVVKCNMQVNPTKYKSLLYGMKTIASEEANGQATGSRAPKDLYASVESTMLKVLSPMVSSSDADAATEAVPTSPAAHERGEEHHEEKVTPDAGALAALIIKLTVKVDSLERSLETHQQRAAVTPPCQGAGLCQSEYRQVLQYGGSLDMRRMQLHELGASNFGMGVQTPGRYGGLGAGQQAGDTPFQAQEAAQQAPQQQLAAQYQAHRPSPLHLNERVPPAKDGMIFMQNIDGSEVYKGLGGDFEQWELLFIDQSQVAEQACGYTWPERYKVNKFGQHLRGKAELFFQQHIMRWWATQLALWFVMEYMHLSFKWALSTQQGMKLFGAKKDPSRSWNEHFLYLTALMMATNASTALALENIVKYADPDLRHALMAKCNITRPDPLQQANELAVWAQMMADEDRAPQHFVQEGWTPEEELPDRSAGSSQDHPVKFALAAGNDFKSVDATSWILDSGVSRYLVSDPALLVNVAQCSGEDTCMLPDGRTWT
ncbi:Mitochondrial Carrier (MC) Family [Phytophthora infestans T30-4]|uniref:Mitochondrial Carrier (MC) Family n=1 Tax=Phytophthora infestans (strain T30-4) TaxID=403677 RepID=D0NZD2_PHYIT|nr:Mitochondrial Carrier (MC) Family [Phytophthora infestans T30-4]EEY69486.1 Mitochondrial Carrier (MC) Family [Phytophthora infestans T30-4]|eukprot:XP_002997253.1 Mitochondrial Carrier (MC) Family [Phytophthora infestans T30-4]